MGVYSMNTIHEGADISTNIIECQFEAGIEGAYAIVAESEQNFNAIMQAVGVAELAVYESTGSEMVYESADIKGFFGKVKQFFVQLWEKIKGLFKKFFAMFDSYTKSDKEFINKYRKHLLQVNTKDFKYKGYKFDLAKINVDKADSAIQTVVDKYVNATLPTALATLETLIKGAEDKADILEEMRGAAVPGQTKLEANELTKELFSILRSGEDSKEEIDSISVSDLLIAISENSSLKKEAEKAFKALEKSVKDAIKTTDRAQNDLIKKVPEKGEDEATKLRAAQIKHESIKLALTKDKLNILQIVNGALLTAIKDKNRQSKAICVRLMNYAPKNEAASIEESGFLSNVVLR